MSLQEKAFRKYLAELVRFLANRSRSAREAKEVASKTYTRLIRLSHLAHDPNAYLFRIARALAYERRHRASG